MRIALDTNVLAYAAGIERAAADGAKIVRSRQVLADLSVRATLVAPVQALGEVFVVLQRAGHAREDARRIVLEFREAFALAGNADTTLVFALDLSVDHKIQFWDSLILSAAGEAGCALLLSEDLQDGLVNRGLTVVDPFAAKVHRKLGLALAQPSA